MEKKTRLYLPLRSNVGWFQNEGMKQAIETRIKEAILLYDEIIIEDGTYMATVFETGSFSPYAPPGKIDPLNRRINFEHLQQTTEAEFRLGIEGTDRNEVILSGKTLANYQIDYYEIFHDIDLKSYSFITTVVINKDKFPEEAVRDMMQRNKSEVKEHLFIHDNYFMRKHIVENLNYDLLTSVLIESAILFDPVHQAILQQKATIPNIYPVKEHIAEQHLFSIAIPDFSTLNLSEVLDLREEPSWNNFRNFLRNATSQITSDPSILHDPNAFNSLIQRMVDKALFEEIEHDRMNQNRTVFDLLMGCISLIPGFGIPTTIAASSKSVAEYYQNQSSWVAFISKIKEKIKT